MTPRFRMTLKGNPRAKQRSRWGKGKMYTPAATKAAEKKISLLAEEMMAGAAPIEGPIALQVDYRCEVPKSWSDNRKRLAANDIILPTSRRTGDLDNLLKLVCDALNKVAFKDDSQIVMLAARKLYADADGPRTIVDLRELDPLEEIENPNPEGKMQ